MPDLDADETLVAVLWLVAAIATVWLWLPIVVTALGGTRYENGGEENPAALEPDGTDAAYASVYAELTARGYEPLGTGYMRLLFYGRRWVYRTTVRAFRSRAKQMFAFVQQLPHVPDYHQVFFATCWADHRLLLTVGGASARIEEETYGFQEFPTENLDELEQLHRKEADELRAYGWQPDPDLSLETLLEATEANAAHSTIRPIAAIVRSELGIVALHLGATAAVAWWFGLDHWAGPATALAGVALYRVLMVAKEAALAETLRRRAAEDRGSGW